MVVWVVVWCALPCPAATPNDELPQVPQRAFCGIIQNPASYDIVLLILLQPSALVYGDSFY